MNVAQNELAEAWDRVARTPDGALIYLDLQRRLMGLLESADPSDGALREDNARRKFAAELMSLMARGIDESDATSSRAPSERPIVIRRAQPVAVGPRDDARSYIARTDPELTARTGRSRGG